VARSQFSDLQSCTLPHGWPISLSGSQRDGGKPALHGQPAWQSLGVVAHVAGGDAAPHTPPSATPA
jgi:hypothetical protein